ncbi:MAG: polysaccharide deacetylase family protein [Elusimicrobia bacterium]|nr:polysaccharide deacetylase family protein [Elusimicrobiota bacterium]MBU2614854.1 polysaccharide deacetylase family protein [Elusimicrobiota bacterium]
MKRLILLSLIVVGGLYIAKDLSEKSFILYYHNVGEYKSGLKSLYISPWIFTVQMQYLNWRGYKAIPLEEFINRIRNNRPFPKKTFAISFDDGYQNNYINALPVLKKYKYPATIFLVVNEIGRKVQHDRTSPEERLTKKEIKGMAKYINFGSHTMTHVNLATEKVLQARNEIAYSKTAIEKITGKKVRIFCYPMGRFNPTVKGFVKENGYTGACSTYSGLIDKKDDVYELPRIEWKEFTNSSIHDFWNLKWFYFKIILGV